MRNVYLVDDDIGWDWDEIVAASDRRSAEWGAFGAKKPVSLSPSLDITGIVDLVAAARHTAVVAILPPSNLPDEAQSDFDGCGEMIRVEHGLARNTLVSDPKWFEAPRKSDSAVLVSSGGSSGKPKLSRVAPENFQQWPEAYRLSGASSAGVAFIGGPWSHSSFVWGLLCAYGTRTDVMVSVKFRARRVSRAFDEHGVTWALLTPQEFSELAGQIKLGWRPKTLLSVVSTGGTVDLDSKKAWASVVGAENVFDLYATTEGIGVLLATAAEQFTHPGTSGRPVWARAAVFDEKGDRIHEVGKVGQLFLQSLARGQSSSKPSFRSAGDNAFLDEEGRVYLVGRSDRVVVVRGANVHLDVVESEIRNCPGVSDALVVAVSSAQGAVIVAGVVASSWGSVRPACVRRVATKIGLAAVPRSWRQLQSVPRTENGKVDYIGASHLFQIGQDRRME